MKQVILFITVVWLCLASFIGGDAQQRRNQGTKTPPQKKEAKRIAHPLLDSSARAYVCGSSEIRNFIAAYDANRTVLEKVDKTDFRTATDDFVRQLNRSNERVNIAQLIDLAIDLQAMASMASLPKDKCLVAAWAEYGPAVADVANKKWETADLSAVDRRALREVVAARQIDEAVAFTALNLGVQRGQFADAFSASLEQITPLAKKDWKTHDPSNVDVMVLDRLTKAYAIDLAGALLGLPPSTPAEVRKAVEANKQHLDALAKKTWRSGDIQQDEELALCRTLKAYSNPAR